MSFEWDDPKAAANLRKHGVSFDEAEDMFAAAAFFEDFDHSETEPRYLAIGFSAKGRMLTVVFTRPAFIGLSAPAKRTNGSSSVMARRNAKPAKSRSPHDDYELPAELNLSKLEFIGFGVDALERHFASQRKTIILDSDVARVFDSSESVNTVLRGIIKSLVIARKRRKSA